MNRIVAAATLVALFAVSVPAQQPDTLRQREDSLALVRELAGQDTMPQRASPGAARVIQRLLPDVSVVGDLVGDFSPDGSTQEDGSRMGIREIELAFQAVVDPYFRGDVYLGFSDAEGVHIEQAYLTTLALTAVELRLGRFLMPVTKANTTHRHDLHTLEYPWIIQRVLGEEGLKGTGLYLSRIFAPLGFYQELQLTAVDRFGEAPEDLFADEPPNRDLAGLGASARLRNYWDLTQAANLEISGSAMTGVREQPIVPPFSGSNAVNARQSLIGGDITYRWRPLQQGLYKSFILQAEFLRQINETVERPDYLGPTRDFSGAYAFARWQTSRRTYLGARFDWMQDPEDPVLPGRTFTAASGYLQWLPSEFSKLVFAFERLMPEAAPGIEATNRFLVQATFALGPHKPHPF
jgi:hypothetical protein